MPKKLFLSSTCYDLDEARQKIEHWAATHGYESLLSNRASFPIDPGMHRHEVCLSNARDSDLFILLVAGRFGAPYHADPRISVTWAEYRSAAASDVPMIAFVDKRVWDERNAQTQEMGRKLDQKLLQYVARAVREKARCMTGHPPSRQAFTQDRRTFDFLSEIQAHPGGHWMEIYESLDAISARLNRLTTLFPATLNRRDGIKRRGEYILAESLSDETLHHMRIVVGDKSEYGDEDLLHALTEIPENAQRLPFCIPMLHGFSVYIKQLAPPPNESFLVRPTRIGEAIRDELGFALTLL